MYLICINFGLGRYVPSASVNTNEIHHSYTCYNYNLYTLILQWNACIQYKAIGCRFVLGVINLCQFFVAFTYPIFV